MIETDCRYAVCGGESCERWHDDIDRAFILVRPDHQQDAHFLMTSYHAAQPPLEVAWYFVMNTNLEQHDFSRYLLVSLGGASDGLEAAVTRAATDPRTVAEELDGD